MSDIWQFFCENGQIMYENISLFVTWTIICVSITISIMKIINDRKLMNMKEENDRLKQENDFLIEQFNDLDEMSEGLIERETAIALSAESVSRRFKHFKKKQRNKKK